MYLTPQEVADLVGVSKARVHQRITGEPPAASGAPLDAETFYVGTQMRYRVPARAALAWRAERAAANQPVGVITDGIIMALERDRIAGQERTTRQAPAVGLPSFRPF